MTGHDLMPEVRGIFSLYYKVKKACGPTVSFYKYLSVPFWSSTDESHSCVQGQQNSEMISSETLKQSSVPSPREHFLQFNFTDDTEQGLLKRALPSLN